MEIIDLPSPVPREVEEPFAHIGYSIRRRRYLPMPQGLPTKSFGAVLSARRTRRCFGILQDDDLANVLWHSAKIHETRVEPSGFTWSHRGAPSAGGRHPIDLISLDLSDTMKAPELYDPLAHCLCELMIRDFKPLRFFVEHVKEIIGASKGVCICFVADMAKTAGKYRNFESLVWRDAGCLLATMHLVAEWYNLNFSAIGPTGEPHVSNTFSFNPMLRGVGACVIGSRPE